MTWLSTVAGLLLVLVALRDVFHTLWLPKGFGGLARTVFRQVWRLQRPLNRRGRSTEVAGPAGLLTVVLVWAALLVVGFALVYWPRMPEGFHYGSSLDPSRTAGPGGALYVSLVALGTLGLGDVMPADAFLRVVLPVEALCGFVLLTAAISWVMQLYPALTRRRALALRLAALEHSGAVEVARTGEPSVAASLLQGLADTVAAVEVDLVQYGESYFFRERRREHALAVALRLVPELVRAGGAHRAPEVRQAASALGFALGELSRTLAEEFLADRVGRGGGGDVEVLRAFAEDHQHA